MITKVTASPISNTEPLWQMITKVTASPISNTEPLHSA
jgi:hypothetical protein